MTMKVAWFHKHGGPEVLVCEEIVTVGAHAGEIVSFDIIPFFRKQLRLVGSKNASTTELRTVMGMVAEGRLKPIIHAAFPLADAAEAHRVVDSREIFGKVLLLP